MHVMCQLLKPHGCGTCGRRSNSQIIRTRWLLCWKTSSILEIPSCSSLSLRVSPTPKSTSFLPRTCCNLRGGTKRYEIWFANRTVAPWHIIASPDTLWYPLPNLACLCRMMERARFAESAETCGTRLCSWKTLWMETQYHLSTGMQFKCMKPGQAPS